MRYLDAAALRQALPMSAAIEAMELAFSDDREVPQRVQLGPSLFMPARVGSHSGIKVVSTVPGNPVGVVMAFGGDGSPIGLVDGATLTAIRTAAGAGLATRLLAAEGAKVLAMLGAGAMAADQVAAVQEVRSIERVVVWSRQLANAQRLADQVQGEAVATADEAVSQADIVSCATPSRTPLFGAGSVSEPVHINAVGAFTPDMIEVPPELTAKAFIVVDDVDAAAVEAGDLIQADRQPDATVGDLLAGRIRPPDGQVTLFKSVGIGSQDTAAAVAALERAAELDLGTVL